MAELQRDARRVRGRPSMLVSMEAALREVEAAIGAGDGTARSNENHAADGDNRPKAGRIGAVATPRAGGNTSMRASRRITVVLLMVGLLAAGGCVTQAKHKEVVTGLEADLRVTRAELNSQRQAMADARAEMTQIQALIDQIDTARKVAKVDVDQAVAALEKLQAWVANTAAAVERLEASIGTDEQVMRKVDTRLSALAMKLSTPASDSAPVRVVEGAPKEE